MRRCLFFFFFLFLNLLLASCSGGFKGTITPILSSCFFMPESCGASRISNRREWGQLVQLSPLFTAKKESGNRMVLKRAKQIPDLGCRRSAGNSEVSVAFVTSQKSDFFGTASMRTWTITRSSQLEQPIVHTVFVANADIQSYWFQLPLYLIYPIEINGHIL